jgi:hypothetical protein
MSPFVSVTGQSDFQFLGEAMSNDFQQDSQFNPYQSDSQGQLGAKPFNPAKVQAPAIAMIIFGSLSLLASIYGMVNALISQPPTFPPDTPEFAIQIAQNSVGPVAAAIQSIFILLAIVILFGGIQMLRLKSWGMALAGAILSIINVGSCCCILGLPLGIWALVILLMADVKQHFAMSSAR